MRYWEDFAAGQVYDLGTYAMTQEEIVEFGQRWDPQPFHTDPEAAVGSAFGGLIASGWHTGCVIMRLYVDGVLHDAASMGSPGLEELRWLAPVRPGDVLHVVLHIDDVAPSTRRADRGTVFLRWEVTNGDGTPVCRARARGLFGRRPSADENTRVQHA